MGPMDQHFASRRPIPLPALRMVRALGKAGMKLIDRCGAPMHMKDAHVEIDKATKGAVIQGKCPTRHRHVRVHTYFVKRYAILDSG
jgi:hypothetical protein